MSGDPGGEKDEREHRVFVNLLAAVVVLALGVFALWLLGFLDDKRRIEACVEAGRRDCLQRFEPAAAPGASRESD